MPYEKNKTAYQDEEWFEREQRNVLDVRNWNRDLMGQTFYQTCHDNKNKYRTIQFKWNPFVESLKPMISNPIDGAPPEGMKPVPAGALQRTEIYFPPTNTPTQGTVSMAHLRNAMNSLIFRSFTVTAF